jgi:hypothetical protein
MLGEMMVGINPRQIQHQRGEMDMKLGFFGLGPGVGRARMQGIMNASNARGKMGAALYIIIPVSTSWWR